MNEDVMIQRQRTIKPKLHNILTHTMNAAHYTVRQNRAFTFCESVQWMLRIPPAYGDAVGAVADTVRRWSLSLVRDV